MDISHRRAKGPLHLLIDSTGIKVEGEWNARKRGGPKRRVRRKLHIGIDELTLEISAVEIIGSNTGDAPMLLTTRADATRLSLTAVRPQYPAAPDCPLMEANYRRCYRQERRTSRIKISESGALA